MINKLFVFIVAVLSLARAGQDYCLPGSDNICKRFGSDYCCALINIKKNGVEDSYHACASASGIDLTDGVFNAGGYSGTWFCNQSTNIVAGAAAALTLLAIATL